MRWSRKIGFLVMLAVDLLPSIVCRQLPPGAPLTPAYGDALSLLFLGASLGITGPLFAKIGRLHGWYRPPHIQALYHHMVSWPMLTIMLIMFNVPFLSPRQPFASPFFRLSAFLLLVAIILVGANCLVFRVHNGSRVINRRGKVLHPGRRYIVTPFTDQDFLVLRDRLRLPAFTATLTTKDRRSRRITVEPVVEIDLVNVQDDQSLAVIAQDLAQRATSSIATRLGRSNDLGFLDVVEDHRVLVTSTGPIPFTWRGDGRICFETQACHCDRTSCQLCHPPRDIHFRA